MSSTIFPSRSALDAVAHCGSLCLCDCVCPTLCASLTVRATGNCTPCGHLAASQKTTFLSSSISTQAHCLLSSHTLQSHAKVPCSSPSLNSRSTIGSNYYSLISLTKSNSRSQPFMHISSPPATHKSALKTVTQLRKSSSHLFASRSSHL